MTQGKIVVGVDGSAESKAALSWAINQACLTRSRLVALTAWDSPPIYGWEAAPTRQNLNTDAARGLAEVIDEITEGRQPVEIEREVANGHPAKALLATAAEGDLLVLGNRGRGAFAAALLGSVTQYCTHHARCPVVVVRAPRNAE